MAISCRDSLISQPQHFWAPGPAWAPAPLPEKHPTLVAILETRSSPLPCWLFIMSPRLSAPGSFVAILEHSCHLRRSLSHLTDICKKMLCFDLQNKNKFGLESCHLVTPNNSCIWLQRLASFTLLCCITYLLVTYLPFYSPLLRVLQSSFNKKRERESFWLNFCLRFTSKNMMMQKGERLDQNHLACQKKNDTIHLSESSASTLNQHYHQLTNRLLFFSFYKVNSYSVKNQREKKSASVFMTLDRRCIIILTYGVLCPVALCSAIEMGLGKSWYKPCPSLPPLLGEFTVGSWARCF